MPLKTGRAGIGKNIKELKSTGRPQAQAVAISLDFARKQGLKVASKQRDAIKRKLKK